MKIRDRIKELRRVPANELRRNPKNWRTHPAAQKEALRGLLDEIGFAGAELARELPDGSLLLIDGHLRAEISDAAEIPVLVVDLNESEADKLLATFDPLGAMAEADPAKLDALLREVQTASQDVAAMLSQLAEEHALIPGISDHDSGDTHFDAKTPPDIYAVIVEFDSEPEQKKCFQDLKKKGLKCRAAIV